MVPRVEPQPEPLRRREPVFEATAEVDVDGGHALDFINKALECLELIGWNNATQILPTIVDQMIFARGAEESTAWRQPFDLVELLEKTFLTLPDLIASSQIHNSWDNHSVLATELLADDPTSIIDALKSVTRLSATVKP